ncbi:MAG: hypothetical protein J7M38_05345 [Armatimonadetes bacterium]|nr:hypothetical protein [Armatimonadota bacterium]
MRPVVTNGEVMLAFDPLIAAGLLAVCALLLVVGLVSMRYLRAMGNLPHMPALMWGARWFGPIIVAALMLYALGLYLGVTHTNYPFTAMAIGRFGIMIIILLPILLLPTQSDGWLLGLLVLTDALRFTSRNYRRWVLKRREAGGRRSYEWIILAVLLAGPAAGAAGVAYNGYQADLESLRVRRTAHTRQVIERALTDQAVRSVTVAYMAPDDRMTVRVLAYDNSSTATLNAVRARTEEVLSSLRGPRTWALTVLTRDTHVERALREALARDPAASITAIRALGEEPSAVNIVLTRDADDDMARAVGERAEQALERAGFGEGWQINVSPGGGPDSPGGLDIDLDAPLDAP